MTSNDAPNAPASGPPQTARRTRAQTVSVFVAGLGAIALLGLALAVASYAVWVAYRNPWLHAAIIAGWLAYGYHLACNVAHRRNAHGLSEPHQHWCTRCQQDARSHRWSNS